MRRLYYMLLVPLFLLTTMTGCQDDEGMPMLSQEFILDANASTVEFRVPYDDWWIGMVTNLQGFPYMDYQLNRPYVLDGVGTLDIGAWFTITHTPYHTFRLSVNHNVRNDEERGIIVHIGVPGSGEWTTYTFRQPLSESVYELKSITYTLEADDVETTGGGPGGTYQEHRNTGTSAYTVLIHPYDGTERTYFFTSKEQGALSWFRVSWFRYPLYTYVPVPDRVENGEIIFNEPPDMAQFGTMSRKSCKMQGTVEVVCEPGKLTLIHCYCQHPDRTGRKLYWKTGSGLSAFLHSGHGCGRYRISCPTVVLIPFFIYLAFSAYENNSLFLYRPHAAGINRLHR